MNTLWADLTAPAEIWFLSQERKKETEQEKAFFTLPLNCSLISDF